MPSQSVFCPASFNWYIAEDSKYTTLDENRDLLGRRIIDPPIDGVYDVIGADWIVGCVDLLLVHEMSHAIREPYRTDDVDYDDSYVWKDVIRLGEFSIGLYNAQNYAIFAAGADLITPPNPSDVKLRIVADGTCQVIPREVGAPS